MGVSMKFFELNFEVIMNLIINKSWNIAGIEYLLYQNKLFQNELNLLILMRVSHHLLFKIRGESEVMKDNFINQFWNPATGFLVTRWISTPHATMISWHRVIVSPVGVARILLLTSWQVLSYRSDGLIN